MKLVFEPPYRALLAQIRKVFSPDQQLYLVGGAVRDVLLGKPLHDMDFAMGGNPTTLARRLAKHLKAGFFVLDDDRHTTRVVYYDSQGQFFPLDFVQFSGQNLMEDLSNRDFTINAMAVPVDQLTQVIDPLGGQSDLEKGVLRACSEHALFDDPVRVLRGVRLAVQFNLDYAPGLEQALQEAGPQLIRTSSERQRDEFFRLLSGSDPAKGLEHFQRLGILKILIPVLAELEAIPAAKEHPQSMLSHAIKTVEKYHALLLFLKPGQQGIADMDWMMQTARGALGKFSLEIETFFRDEVTPGRDKPSLAFFGTLLHELGTSGTSTGPKEQRILQHNHYEKGAQPAFAIAKQLTLSTAESHWVQTLVQHHMDLLPFVADRKIPDQRAIFHFFKQTGDVGVAIALHFLADAMALKDQNLDQERWRWYLSVVEAVLSAWWEKHSVVVKPTLLLDGFDLQDEFGLMPGKTIGALLSQLEEEQASGTIINSEQARDFIRKRMIEGVDPGENDEN